MSSAKAASPPASRSLIGEALIKEGLLTSEQLDRALRIQKHLEQQRQLGEVLMELGYVTKQAIRETINKHGSGMRLGDMLVEQGLISQEHLTLALRIQKDRGMKLGEALVEIGAINERTLLQNLASQARVPYIEPVFAMVEANVLSGISPDYMEKNLFVPFSKSAEGRVTVVVNDLKDDDSLHAVNDLFKGTCDLALGPKDAIKQTIEDYRRFRTERHGDGHKPTVEAAEDSVIKLVEHILSTAVDDRASDIHIEPMSDKIRLRYRIDGVLVYKTDLPKDLLPRVVSRIKVLGECNITEHQRHQGGRFMFKVGQREFDMRLSVYCTVHGESIVMRILNKQTGIIGLEGLGMSASMRDRYRNDVLDVPTGVVLITGPTGSGKTSTLYSSLEYSNTVDTKIITAEDPVEYMIDGIIQCSI
ncbi:MAG TPA: ATPase, T2SS/T4P/T4SS family, partial [Candidatus Hydrogenedentes bacterium]|nr:ATPase, T2SS/T4P/T4SS family [Candidatus Hydrogenedentota bacterium]